MRRFRAGVALGCSFVIGAAVAIGCGDDDGTPTTINQGTGTDAAIDDDTTDKDAGKKADADAGQPGIARDANGPGGDGATCSFNWDCQLMLRCECNGDCACTTGTRGVGKPGGGCEDGNDCISAVCLEGANDELLCSDGCKVPANCPANLPRCEDVAFVGRICVREPPP